MTENVDRNALAAILERLGSMDDADALSAAREAHAIVARAGASWTELIDAHPAPGSDDAAWEDDRSDDESDAADDGDGWNGTDEDMTDETNREVATGTAASPAGGGRSNTDTLRLLDRLLAQEKGDAVFCAELEGYKRDIANGEFDDRDRNYVRDLYDRLRKAPTPS